MCFGGFQEWERTRAYLESLVSSITLVLGKTSVLSGQNRKKHIYNIEYNLLDTAVIRRTECVVYPSVRFSVFGGGAENRTPVHTSSLKGISKLSLQRGFGQGRLHTHDPIPSWFNLSLCHTSYVHRSIPLNGVSHVAGNHTWSTSLHYQAASAKRCLSINLTVPLFKVARRPPLASLRKTIMSNPVAPMHLRKTPA